MKVSITKAFTFEAAHFLPDYEGPCANVHGHSYKLEVTVSGPLGAAGNVQGMVMDFTDLKRAVDEAIISQWDHKSLNDVVSFRPTAENLATEAFNRLKKAGLPVTRVRLWETAKNFATAEE